MVTETMAVVQLVCWLGTVSTPPKLMQDAQPQGDGIMVLNREPYATQTLFTIPCVARWDLLTGAGEESSELWQVACYDSSGNVVLRDRTKSWSQPTSGTLEWDSADDGGHILTNLPCVVDEEP